MQYDLWFDHVKHEFSVSTPLHLANVKTNIKIKTDTEYKIQNVESHVLLWSESLQYLLTLSLISKV